jgi:hypothetical protein
MELSHAGADMEKYPRTFLRALGAWQRGWREDADRRRKLTLELREAIAHAKALPVQAFLGSEVCYRKRFLVPNNGQNGGDFWPLFAEGSISEGIASWSTDHRYAKLTFKKGLREGVVWTLFATTPKQDDIVLNIVALWKHPDFGSAVSAYAAGGGEFAEALQNLGPFQSEVLLRSTLNFDDITAFAAPSRPSKTFAKRGHI